METSLPVRKSVSILGEMERMHEQIMRRAFEIFDGNGHTYGRDLDDWLKAERELVWQPAIELEEKENKIQLQVAVPGVEAKNIEIEMTPEEVLVKAEIRHEHEKDKSNVYACEFATGNLFRAVRLPKKIDPDSAKAEFKDGMLRLTADVARESQPRKIAVEGA